MIGMVDRQDLPHARTQSVAHAEARTASNTKSLAPPKQEKPCSHLSTSQKTIGGRRVIDGRS
jgi:hypothetical protein